MKLGELILCKEKRIAEITVTGITCNSKEVKEGYVFVCINGTAIDGHNFAAGAVESGASVIIAERDLGLENQIIVDSLTGVNYFYHQSGYSGGLTPLLDSQGKPIVTPITEE